MDTKISACKQKDDETIQEFYVCLTDVFTVHNSTDHPADLGNEITAWEADLKNGFIKGLWEEMAAKVERNFISWKNYRLGRVRHHVHVDNDLKAQQIKKNEKQKKGKPNHVSKLLVEEEAVQALEDEVAGAEILALAKNCPNEDNAAGDSYGKTE